MRRGRLPPAVKPAPRRPLLFAGILLSLACGGCTGILKSSTWEENSSDSDGGARKDEGIITWGDGLVDPLFPRAFPGAEGFGAAATGGRGGRVIRVTTLDADGPGSLQEALNVDQPRIIVFTVSGVIEADIIEVPHGNVTIAGQTAPGAGITIRGRFYAAYEEEVTNIIVRHLRIRPNTFASGGGEQHDGMQFSVNSNMIFDHLSVAYGVDETVDLYSAKDVTFQWCTVECAATEGHPEGEHNYGLINGPEGRRLALHHNLFVHNKNRNPAIANGPAEVRNNVIYNVQNGFVHHNPASGPFNIVGNYYRQGPSASIVPFFFDDENDFGAEDLGYFLSANYIDDPGDYEGLVDNPWIEPFVHSGFQHLNAPESLRADSAYSFVNEGNNFIPITTQDPQAAYTEVLRQAGCLPRDKLTADVVQETLDRSGQWGARQIDPMEGLQAGTPPADQDSDGMADAWELEHSLDPANGDDHRTVMSSGYTAIEEYINGLAWALEQQGAGH